MATYIMLANYTEQGIKAIRDTTRRAADVKELAAKHGLDMKETYWVLGPHDIVAVFEAPDDAAITAFALTVARQGNIKTQTMRAFTASEMQGVLDKMG